MGRETSTGDPRGSERVARGDGEVRSSKEASNDRGAKGPQFKGNVGRNKRIVIGPRPSNLMTPRQTRKTLNGLSEGEPGFTVCKSAGTLVRKPDAGNLPVRFDERDLETEHLRATAPDLDSTRGSRSDAPHYLLCFRPSIYRCHSDRSAHVSPSGLSKNVGAKQSENFVFLATKRFLRSSA